MLVLLRLDPADSRAARAYRLQVKERLYRFNYVSRTSQPLKSLNGWVYVGNIDPIGATRKTRKT